jgi:uncharacterized protein (TIGR03435 family)
VTAQMPGWALRCLRQGTVIAVLCAALTGQSPDVPQWQIAAGGKMAFDVASVKLDKGPSRSPSFPLDNGDAFTPGNRFFADFRLLTYIRFAYKASLTPEQSDSILAQLPKWVASDRFEIQARAEGNPTKDQMRLMMQSLLADRFKLAIHFETRDVPVFALTLVKPGEIGPKLRPHADGPPCDAPDVFASRCDAAMLEMKPNRMYQAGARNVTMASVADILPSLAGLGRPVLDQTGLSGRFDFVVEWAPESNGPLPPNADAQPDSQGPTFLEALGEQLGLKLKSTRGPVQALVVDHVENLSEN